MANVVYLLRVIYSMELQLVSVNFHLPILHVLNVYTSRSLLQLMLTKTLLIKFQKILVWTYKTLAKKPARDKVAVL